jgi:hypothetical protein
LCVKNIPRLLQAMDNVLKRKATRHLERGDSDWQYHFNVSMNTSQPRQLGRGDFPQKLHRQVRFLHFPKTGTSFFRVLIAHNCPQILSLGELETSFRLVVSGKKRSSCLQMLAPGHQPLSKTADISTFVTLLRDPTTRIASGYVHNFHDCTPMQREFKLHDHSNGNLTQCDEAHFDDAIPRYFKCVQGCMTRMLIGKTCGPSMGEVSSKADQILAFHRLKKMAFVGFTDTWNATINRFYRQYPAIGARFRRELFGKNTRPSNSLRCRSRVIDYLRRNNYTDIADLKLFHAAKQHLL